MKPTNVISYTSADSASERGESFLHHIWASIASTIILTIICCGFYPLVICGIAHLIFPHQANGSLVKKDGAPATNDSDAVGSSLLGQTFAVRDYFHPRPSAANNSAGSSYLPHGGYDPTSSGASNYGPLSNVLINGQTTSPMPPATQPAEYLAYDGIRLRTIHYALDNKIEFNLYNAVYVKHDDGSYTLQRKDAVPLKKFQDEQGNLNDIGLVDAFPNPTSPDEYKRTVIIAGDFKQPIPGDAVTASGSGLDPHISPANAEIQKSRVASARNINPAQVESLIAAHTDGPSLGFLGDPGVNVLMLNLDLDVKYPIASKGK